MFLQSVQWDQVLQGSFKITLISILIGPNVSRLGSTNTFSKFDFHICPKTGLSLVRMATVAKIQKQFGLGDSSSGLIVVDPAEASSTPELSGQAHYIRRAFDRLDLDAVVCVDGVPTVLLASFGKPIARAKVNDLQRKFWNLGTGTLLVLLDPTAMFVFSGMMLPSNDDGEITEHEALVEKLDLVADTLDACQLVTRVATGRYYRDHSIKFKPANTVDQYLLSNLGHVGDLLRRDNSIDERKRVHALLGRIIFTSYLVDRGIVSLADYSFVRKRNIVSLLDLLTAYDADALYKVFEQLRHDFNGSMFETDLSAERASVTVDDISTLTSFLRGDEVRSGQGSLGFWAYDFASIPVETISAIYEKFLEEEDATRKGKDGAFYTPRHLAEMVVDEATAHLDSLSEVRCLDPACGSGIFLVVLFNRIAEEYRCKNPNVITRTRLNKLVDVLEHQICGVDVNLTACRIACFSLYIAYLDQFDSKTLKELQLQSDKILPNLLAYQNANYENTETPVVYEGNFFDPKLPIRDSFDVVVGNPPWVGRNQSADQSVVDWVKDAASNPFLEDAPRAQAKRMAIFLPQKQIAHAFMWKTPLHLSESGRVCLLLPVQVLLNRTDAFQHAWFNKMRVDRVFNLSDFRYFLFQDAIRPASILLFGREGDSTDSHRVEHVAPKVRQQDRRSGLIKVFPEDRKWVSTAEILEASREKNEEEENQNSAATFWKTLLWGSPRDIAFVEYLLGVECLGDIAGDPEEGKRWIKGEGFQPWYQISFDRNPDTYGNPKPIRGKLSDPFIKTVDDSIGLFLLPQDTISLEKRLDSIGHEGCLPSKSGFRRSPDKNVFTAPLVLINKGFTKFAYSSFDVMFQHSLRGVSGPPKDAKLLNFLVVFLKSRLAKYYFFHTAGSLGTERDEVRVHELMRLPFPLPDSHNTHKDAEAIVEEVASRVQTLQKEVAKEYADAESAGDFELHAKTLAESRRSRVEQLQAELEPLVYKYFNLNRYEIMHVEDTCKIISPSATPTSPTIPTKTTDQTSPVERKLYADLLCKTLNKWSKSDQSGNDDPSFYFAAELASFVDVGMVLLTLTQAGSPTSPCEVTANGQLKKALSRITKSSSYEQGSFTYLRGKIFASGKKIHILKQDMRAHWMRTSALNDADQIFQAIVSSTKAKKK